MTAKQPGCLVVLGGWIMANVIYIAVGLGVVALLTGGPFMFVVVGFIALVGWVTYANKDSE